MFFQVVLKFQSLRAKWKRNVKTKSTLSPDMQLFTKIMASEKIAKRQSKMISGFSDDPSSEKKGMFVIIIFIIDR